MRKETVLTIGLIGCLWLAAPVRGFESLVNFENQDNVSNIQDTLTTDGLQNLGSYQASGDGWGAGPQFSPGGGRNGSKGVVFTSPNWMQYSLMLVSRDNTGFLVLDFPNEMSFSWDINPSQLPDPGKSTALLWTGANRGTGECYLAITSNGGLAFYMLGYAYQVTTATPVTVNQWQTVGFTLGKANPTDTTNTLKFYYNGVALETYPAIGGLNLPNNGHAPSSPVQIGWMYNIAPGDQTQYRGLMDNVFMADRRLTDAEMFALAGADTTEMPSFNPDGGSYLTTNPPTVTITCPTANATIRYTTNGVDPAADNTTGTIYTAPVPINTTTTLKARAFAAGKNPSAVKSATYTLVQPLEFKYDFEDQNDPLNILDVLTTDGPQDASTFNASGGFGFGPTLNASVGRLGTAGLDFVNINPSTYTDGSLLTTHGVWDFRNEMSLSMDINPNQLPPAGRAMGLLWTGANRGVGECSLVILNSGALSFGMLGYGNATTTQTPIVLDQYQTVGFTLGKANPSDTTNMLTFYYNGNVLETFPNFGPLDLPNYGHAPNSPVMFGWLYNVGTGDQAQFRGYMDNIFMADRRLSASEMYDLANTTPLLTTATPTFDPDGGVYSQNSPPAVTMACATPDATIRYTTDGSDPATDNTTGTIYTGPVTVNSSMILKARAFATGRNRSSVKSARYSIVLNQAQIPQASLTIDGSLADWPAGQWSPPFVWWSGVELMSTTQARFAWNDAQDLLYVAVQTNESSARTGGHLVIGPTKDNTSVPTQSLTSTQLCFDYDTGYPNNVWIRNELNFWGLPGVTTGVQAAGTYNAGSGMWTYEIAIPLWSNWTTGTGLQPLSANDIVYVYVVMQDLINTSNGTDMSWYGNPQFYMGSNATPNAWTRAAALTLVSAPSAFNLTGTVVLNDYVGDVTTIPVTVELRSGSTRTENVNLNAGGVFTIANVDPDTYDVWIKASHWLAKLTGGVVVSGNTDIGTVALTNGDSDEDNEVTTSDLANVLFAMDAMPGDPNWLPESDLDGDEEVTTSDLATVLLNMDAMGD